MDLKGVVMMVFGNGGGGRRTSAELSTAIAKAEAEISVVAREVRVAQDRLDGMLTDRDVGLPTTDREVEKARRTLDEANSKARTLRVMLDRARRDKGAALEREAREAHAAHLERLSAAAAAHEAAIASFVDWAKACPAVDVRETLRAFLTEVPKPVLANTALPSIAGSLVNRLEQEAFFLTEGAFPGPGVVSPRMPSAFFADYRPMVNAFTREAATAIERVTAAAPDAVVTQAA